MPPDHWMQWDGWRWISPFLGMAIGLYFGWDVRGIRERSRAFLLSLSTDRSVALTKLLAGMKDPRTCPSIDDELEAFAHVIDTAKSIHGDLREDADADQP